MSQLTRGAGQFINGGHVLVKSLQKVLGHVENDQSCGTTESHATLSFFPRRIPDFISSIPGTQNPYDRAGFRTCQEFLQSALRPSQGASNIRRIPILLHSLLSDSISRHESGYIYMRVQTICRPPSSLCQHPLVFFVDIYRKTVSQSHLEIREDKRIVRRCIRIFK